MWSVKYYLKVDYVSQRPVHECTQQLMNNSPKLKPTQMSINRWTDKQTGIYSYNRILLICIPRKTALRKEKRKSTSGNKKKLYVDTYN